MFTKAAGLAAPQADAVCSMATTSEAVPALRAFARDTARRWGMAEDAVHAVRVTVSELVTNAVLHSGSPDVELGMRLRGATVTVLVKDNGTWLPREPSPVRRCESDRTRGRGLNIVRAYATHCSVESSVNGTRVRAEFDVSAPAPEFAAFDAELMAVAAL
ncbi:ATP-binding protein [Streptomyces sp. GXMU-J15]|uniref:ATP-binding protein n=1 Tax=Streptomyces fuscus TaxID=3048495 RepID=A0ABT7J3R8_9ACTN|nr:MULTISPECIES: ATP-binding protein [Streptomyces]MDL2078223.1 ATP-binding protein [Streptomyces fuscus]SBT89969.1 Anti-sigma regulatory factor (Ser/Thr protein kinase) [Streptomyces sp. DI166]